MLNKIIKLQKIDLVLNGITACVTLITTIPVLSEFSEKFNNINDKSFCEKSTKN